MDQKRQELLQHLQAAKTLADELHDELTNDPIYRKEVTRTSKTILRKVQLPFERAWEIFTFQNVMASLRLSLEAGWLDHVANVSPSGATVGVISKETGSDEALVNRIMRLLATAGIIDEVDVRTYARNGLTVLLTTTVMRNGAVIFSDLLPSLGRMHLYFDNTQYRTPPAVADCPFAFTEGMTFWKRMAVEPRRQAAFDAFMNSRRTGNTNQWFEKYPIEDFRLDAGEDTLLVDVGGGIGHILASFNEYRKALNMTGRLVLQDLPNVLAKVPEEWAHDLTKVNHDFFKPQPSQCRNARAYYMRMIMHDWSDTESRTILGHLRDAMKPGYSTLLINESILPETDCPYLAATNDISMMVMTGGKERTLQDWHELIGGVPGLKIDKIVPINEGTRFEHIIQIGRCEE